MEIVVAFYVAAGVWLAIYGINSLVLAGLYLHHGRNGWDRPASQPNSCPVVTVQLPVYNERYVIERLIDAVAALNWPRAQLQIQILDDSNDETTALAGLRVQQ